VSLSALEEEMTYPNASKTKEYEETHRNRPIHSKDGKELGKVIEVVLAEDGSKIKYAIIDFGEPFRSENKRFAVSWDAIEFTKDGSGILDFDVDPDVLNRALPLDEDNAEEVEMQRRLADVSLLFLQRPTPL
jgi:sporulation protein YlmC with PRC-barrel domain